MGYSKRQGGSYEGRQGQGKGFKRYPVEVGEELEVDIVELSPKEEGIARVQGLVIHVADAKQGRPRENKDNPSRRHNSRSKSNKVVVCS
jgi:predicted RNA-binding protein with TRAM domain